MARQDPWLWRGIGGCKRPSGRGATNIRGGTFKALLSASSHIPTEPRHVNTDKDPQWDFYFEMREV